MKRTIKLIMAAAITLPLAWACNKPKAETPPPANDYTRAVTENSSKWISKIVEYRPAPGQFINKAPGTPTSAESIVGKAGQVTLGGYGGYIVFMFDHTVLNGAGADFVVRGNAAAGNSEPGVVMVSFDENGNGKADDGWYELRGSEFDRSKRSHDITYTRPSQTETAEDIVWTDSEGMSGKMLVAPTLAFHKQCFYPLFLADDPSALTFSGTLLPLNATQTENGQWVMAAYESGYTDNFSADYMDKVGDDDDTARSNKFDISNAVDGDGHSVQLKGVDFIKVQTAVNGQAGWVGEISTEVLGAISLTVR